MQAGMERPLNGRVALVAVVHRPDAAALPLALGDRVGWGHGGEAGVARIPEFR